jgi:hypothetical protein
VVVVGSSVVVVDAFVVVVDAAVVVDGAAVVLDGRAARGLAPVVVGAVVVVAFVFTVRRRSLTRCPVVRVVEVTGGADRGGVVVVVLGVPVRRRVVVHFAPNLRVAHLRSSARCPTT